VNAFLVRSEDSEERSLIHVLSDLRIVHLIHQSITPDRAGERYEAYIIDYSIFTGFRRRRNIREMVPEEAQFKAAELRALPKVYAGFLKNWVVPQRLRCVPLLCSAAPKTMRWAEASGTCWRLMRCGVFSVNVVLSGASKRGVT
jgi:hypothetical protein